MDISTDILRKAGVTLSDRDERARRAVQAFRAMQPGLNSYARVLTKRRDIRIEMAVNDNGSTDGNRIFFRPPMALGDKLSHDKQLCDKRDKRTKQLLCQACRVREEVLVTIYHEIAHICYNSFEQTTDKDLAESTRRAIEETGGSYAEKIMQRIKAAPSWKTTSFIGLSNFISPWMPLIVNALEDARVNREAFKARKGTKKMFDASTWRIFTEGVEQLDPRTGELIVVPWNKYPLNMQAIIGVFCKASGYNDYSEWFVEPVVEALDDEELTRIIARMDTVRSAAGVYYLSFPVLKRLRELGFCRDESDPEDEPEPQPEPEPEEQSEEQSDQSEDEGESDSDQPSDDDSSEESDDEEGSSSGEDDSSDDSDGDEGAEDSDDGAEVGSSDSESEDQDGDSTPGGDDADDSEPGDDSVPGERSAEDSDESSDADGRPGDSAGDDAEPSPADESDPDDSGDQPGEGDEVSDNAETTESGDEASASDSDGVDSPPPGEGEPEDEAGTDSSDMPDGSGEGSGGLGPSEGELDSSDSDTSGEAGSSEGDDLDTDFDPSEIGGGQPESSDEADDGEPEAIDTGADLGRGGIELIEDEANDDVPLEMGTAEEVKPLLLKWGDHDEAPPSVHESEIKADDKALETAIIQSLYFETPSRNIEGVREARLQDGVDKNDPYNTWHTSVWSSEYTKTTYGVLPPEDDTFDPSEQMLGPALLRARRVFADNERGKELRNLKAGKVNPRVLGKRVYHDDPRLFRKKSLPGRRSYFVVLGVDVSGSTMGVNLILEKKAVMAQAELCARLGIDFAIIAHSGSPQGLTRREGMRLDIFCVKDKEEPWDTHIKQRLRDIGPVAYNLDGHALEYLRKVCDRSTATDKIILYYSDGKMPAENGPEEGEILRREIKVCRQKGYTLLGVGIRTDSPARHGLDTVRVEKESDLIKVVTHLEKRLVRG